MIKQILLDKNAKTSQNNINRMVEDIKSKKELGFLDSEVIKKRLLERVQKNPFFGQLISSGDKYERIKKSRYFKNAFKEIRKELHHAHGVFLNKSYFQKQKLLNQMEEHLKKTGKIDKEAIALHQKIIQTHLSTRERIKSYGEIYTDIFKITGKPKKVLDLASGLNPLSYPWMNIAELKYVASELNHQDVQFLQKYFDIVRKYSKMRGNAFKMDLLEIEDKKAAQNVVKEHPEVKDNDVCFLFKTLPTLEKSKKNISKDLLQWVPTKWVVVSFSSKSMHKGMNIAKARQEWFEKILKGLKYNYKLVNSENEVFYVIKK